MSIVRINALEMAEGRGEDFLERFSRRPERIETMDGFEGFQVLRPSDGRDTWLVLTRWRDEAAFEGWLATRTPRDPATTTYAKGWQVWAYDLLQDVEPPAAAPADGPRDGGEPQAGTGDDVRQGPQAGGADGTATLVELVGRADPRGGRPGAVAVLETDDVKVVSFEFAAGDVLTEHAARHPVLVQVQRGRVAFTLPDRTVELVPGQTLHLTPMLRHAVEALEPTTLTVTMLLPRS